MQWDIDLNTAIDTVIAADKKAAEFEDLTTGLHSALSEAEVVLANSGPVLVSLMEYGNTNLALDYSNIVSRTKNAIKQTGSAVESYYTGQLEMAETTNSLADYDNYLDFVAPNDASIK